MQRSLRLLQRATALCTESSTPSSIWKHPSDILVHSGSRGSGEQLPAAMAAACSYCSQSCCGASVPCQPPDIDGAAPQPANSCNEAQAVQEAPLPQTGSVGGGLGHGSIAAAASAAAAALSGQLAAASLENGAGSQQLQQNQLPPKPGLPPGKTFYKRTLPSPPAIAFSSPEGRCQLSWGLGPFRRCHACCARPNGERSAAEAPPHCWPWGGGPGAPPQASQPSC